MYRMKTYLFLAVAAAAGLSSCTDDAMLTFIDAQPSALSGEYAYLNDYDVLKNYVDRAVNPDFRLGCGAEFTTSSGMNYMMACTNFDEVTPGNLMKYASCVSDDGSTDYSAVGTFVSACKSGGLTTYGHTLCWHSQQRPDYLNGLIADAVADEGDSEPEEVLTEKLVNGDFEGDDLSTSYICSGNDCTMEISAAGQGSDGSGHALVMSNAAVQEYDYNSQLIIQFSPATEVGETYIFSCDIRADEECTVTTQAQSAPYQYKYWDMFGDLNFSTEWETFSKTLTIDDNREGCTAVSFNLGLTATNFYFDNISLKKQEYVTKEAYVWDELVPHGDFEEETDGEDEYQANGSATLSYVPGGGSDGGQCIKVSNPSVKDNSYEAQFIFQFSPAASVGDEYEFSVDVKADEECSFGTQAQTTPGNYLYWNMFGDIACTTSWETFSKTVTITDDLAGLGAVAFDLGLNATNYYFDNLSFKKKVPAETLSKSDEEKKEILSEELARWIEGMMKACDGYVTSWDVVNEPLSGTDTDGDGYYDPWNNTTGDPSSNFYWQEYLGNVDFVRLAVKYAREYFEEYGGNPSDLKLFINDYNLESDWDDNKKIKSMAHWVEQWEADGVTKIDGLGTQMHVSCYADSVTQASKEAHIEQMFEIMAATGKLVKISELDMGYVDADGNDVATTDMTEEAHHRMADFYKFIVEKYFEIIPPAQRYGITHWTATDSPASSSWRAGTPCGLWDEDYNRKHTYAGFADGLGQYSGLSDW